MILTDRHFLQINQSNSNYNFDDLLVKKNDVILHLDLFKELANGSNIF